MKYKSAVGRPISITYLSNLLMLGLVSLIGVVVFSVEYMNTDDVMSALQSAFAAAIVAGASWVIARELDPEHDYSAFVGMIPAVLLLDGDVSLWTIGAFVMLTRVVSRVVGPSASILDSIATIIVVGFAVFATGSWLIGILGMVAFILDARLNDPQPRQYIFAGIVALITLAKIALDDVNVLTLPSGLPLGAILLITAGYLMMLMRTATVNITADYGKKYIINQPRVKISMLMIVLGVLAMSLWGGDAMIKLVLPIWTAAGGVVMYWMIQKATGFNLKYSTG